MHLFEWMLLRTTSRRLKLFADREGGYYFPWISISVVLGVVSWIVLLADKTERSTKSHKGTRTRVTKYPKIMKMETMETKSGNE